jgi:hypothetical protein
MSNLDEWKHKGRTALRRFFQRLSPVTREAARKGVMYGATAAVLLPLLQLEQEPAAVMEDMVE